MNNKKINIFFPFIENGASAGGNNFLKALRTQFQKMEVWTDKPEEADVIIFNSHQNHQELIDFYENYKDKVFVHRVDGPMSIYTNSYDNRDIEVKVLNECIANKTVYQSKWSKNKCIELGITDQNPNIVIHNAPNPTIFSPQINKIKSDRLKIITSGWSTNKNKGSDALVWLDNNLDFSLYQLDCIGPQTYEFDNINSIGVKPPEEMGNILREYDIFFFPSIYESCSNALLEGIHSGLIPLARNTSSNVEIVNERECLFDNYEEIPNKLIYIQENYSEISKKFTPTPLEKVAQSYYDFAINEKSSHKKFSKETIRLKIYIEKIKYQLLSKLPYSSKRFY